MNVLSKLIDKAVVDRSLGYHPKCKNVQLTHLCFADDLMVFVDGRKRSVERVISIFDGFAEISGLRISVEKSTLYRLPNGCLKEREKLCAVFSGSDPNF